MNITIKIMASIAALLSVTAAWAATLPSIKTFDADENDMLTPPEIRSYANALEESRMAGARGALRMAERLKQARAASASQGANVILVEPLLEIERQYINSDGSENLCEEQSIFLEETIIDRPINRCQLRQVEKSGAAFTLKTDFENETTVLGVKGGIGIVLARPDLYDSAIRAPRGDAAVEEAALIAFAEAEGTRTIGTAGDGFVRLGLKGEANVGGVGPFSDLYFGLSGFYQSDFELEGEGYGGQLTLTPQSARYGINGAAVIDGEPYDYFILNGTVDAFHVDTPGDTGLTAGDDYVWVGGEIGYSYFTPLVANGVQFTGKVLGFYDLASGEDAVEANVGLDIFLNESKTTALGIDYTVGTSRQDLVFEDEISVSLKVLY